MKYKIKLKDGTLAKEGDLIRWHCDDSDDCVTWVFTGLYVRGKVVYLGGGVDFGMGIGQDMDIKEVVEQSLNNNSVCVGIEKIGVANDCAIKIKEIYNG